MRYRPSLVFAAAVISSLLTYLVMSVPASRGEVDHAAGPEDHPLQGNGHEPLVVDERDMRWWYANAYRIHTTADELIMDFGFNMLDTSTNGGDGKMIFKVPDRVIMSYPSAKRLQQSLTRVIERYEKQFGEIKPQADTRK